MIGGANGFLRYFFIAFDVVNFRWVLDDHDKRLSNSEVDRWQIHRVPATVRVQSLNVALTMNLLAIIFLLSSQMVKKPCYPAASRRVSFTFNEDDDVRLLS